MKFILARVSHKEVPECSGIYIIHCRNNRRFYIGSTFNFRGRFGKHLSKLIRKKHPNKTLQKLFNKQQVLFFRIVKPCGMIEMMRFEMEELNRIFENRILNISTVRYYRRRKVKC